jgi:hypothetical protein
MGASTTFLFKPKVKKYRIFNHSFKYFKMNYNVVLQLDYTNSVHVFKENSTLLYFLEIQKWYEYRKIYNDRIRLNFIYLTRINGI